MYAHREKMGGRRSHGEPSKEILKEGFSKHSIMISMQIQNSQLVLLHEFETIITLII